MRLLPGRAEFPIEAIRRGSRRHGQAASYWDGAGNVAELRSIFINYGEAVVVNECKAISQSEGTAVCRAARGLHRWWNREILRKRCNCILMIRIDAEPISLSLYRRSVGGDVIDRIASQAADLRGLRVVHINATADGGGVAEILRSLVPLSRSLGIHAEWLVLPADASFFEVTKLVHNCLQGQPGKLTLRQKHAYRGYLDRVAAGVREERADVWVVHDPQPMALRALAPLHGPAIWRCHLDCSTPNDGVGQYVLRWTRNYDRAVFSMPQYVLPGLSRTRVRVAYPAIDPLTPKNRSMRMQAALGVLAGLGIDPHRPLVVQVSRFDRWKNPRQALQAYRLAKREIPELQLALVGTFTASDDPEAPVVYSDVRKHVNGDLDVHLFTNPAQVGPREINAFQTASTVVLQRSEREGFGLTVTEAMWKRRPVIATPVGGITAQIQHGRNGFLVNSAEGCAEHIVQMVRDRRLAGRIGEAARETVRQQFLLPRLLEDDLRLYLDVLGSGVAAA